MYKHGREKAHQGFAGDGGKVKANFVAEPGVFAGVCEGVEAAAGGVSMRVSSLPCLSDLLLRFTGVTVVLLAGVSLTPATIY